MGFAFDALLLFDCPMMVFYLRLARSIIELRGDGSEEVICVHLSHRNTIGLNPI